METFELFGKEQNFINMSSEVGNTSVLYFYQLHVLSFLLIVPIDHYKPKIIFIFYHYNFKN